MILSSLDCYLIGCRESRVIGTTESFPSKRPTSIESVISSIADCFFSELRCSSSLCLVDLNEAPRFFSVVRVDALSRPFLSSTSMVALRCSAGLGSIPAPTELSESLSRAKAYGRSLLLESDSDSLWKLDEESLLLFNLYFSADNKRVALRSIFFSVSVTCLWSWMPRCLF